MKKRRFSGNSEAKTHFKVNINVRYFRQATMNEIESATTKDETANEILQYKNTKDFRKKSDGNGMTDKRGFRQAG